MLSPWLAMLLVMTILALLIHLLGSLNKFFGVEEEVVRKALHLCMGAVTLSFPWLFDQVWPVITLSIVSSIFIAIVKVSGLKEWRSVLCAKGRISIGEICFPLSVGILFLLSHDNIFAYLAPVAILTFADSASALIGTRYGRRKYLTVDGHKSQEGSFAFLLIAFLTTFSIAQLTTQLDLLVSILLSLVVAIIAMMFEAIAWKGLDNLSIPLGSYLAIRTHINMPFEILLESFVILSIMAVTLIALKKRSTLTGSAVLGVVLFCYFTLLTAGPLWLLSPVLLFLSYKYLLPKRFQSLKNFHTIYGVIAVSAVGIVWIMMASNHSDIKFLFPYTLAFGAHASIISIAHMRFNRFNKAKTKAITYAILKAWFLMCFPMLLLDPTPHMISLYIFLAPICIGVPTFMFYLANSGNFESLTKPRRWLKQASLASLASAIGFIPLVL